MQNMATVIGPAYVLAVRADTAMPFDHLETELRRLAEAGVDDVVLLPCAGGRPRSSMCPTHSAPLV